MHLQGSIVWTVHTRGQIVTLLFSLSIGTCGWKTLISHHYQKYKFNNYVSSYNQRVHSSLLFSVSTEIKIWLLGTLSLTVILLHILVKAVLKLWLNNFACTRNLLEHQDEDITGILSELLKGEKIVINFQWFF